jgi:hypothetical protein
MHGWSGEVQGTVGPAAVQGAVPGAFQGAVQGSRRGPAVSGGVQGGGRRPSVEFSLRPNALGVPGV